MKHGTEDFYVMGNPDINGMPHDSSSPRISMIYFFNFLFYIGVSPVKTVMLVSDEQQRNSGIHTHLSVLSQTPLLSRLPHDVEQSSLFTQ